MSATITIKIPPTSTVPIVIPPYSIRCFAINAIRMIIQYRNPLRSIPEPESQTKALFIVRCQPHPRMAPERSNFFFFTAFPVTIQSRCALRTATVRNISILSHILTLSSTMIRLLPLPAQSVRCPCQHNQFVALAAAPAFTAFLFGSGRTSMYTNSTTIAIATIVKMPKPHSPVTRPAS